MSERKGSSWMGVARASTVGWFFVFAAFAALMAVGIQRDSSPATPQERIESVSRRLACPTCDGESVAESRGTASQAIRQEISRLVAQGQLTDDEIVASIDESYAESLRLTPGSSGLESLIWVLPIFTGVVAVAGLVIAFSRWRRAPADAQDNQRASTHDSAGGSSKRKWMSGRSVLGVAAVAVLAITAGIAVARNTGERRPGQVMTGGGGEASVSALLVEARSLGMGDITNALDLYARVLEQEPDNVEALTYFGWLTVLSASQAEDQDLAATRLESGLVLLRQATIIDAAYPDARCFLGITFFRFLDDAEAAAPEIETCLESNPPSEVAVLVEELAAQIASEVAGSGSTESDSIPE